MIPSRGPAEFSAVVLGSEPNRCISWSGGDPTRPWPSPRCCTSSGVPVFSFCPAASLSSTTLLLADFLFVMLERIDKDNGFPKMQLSAVTLCPGSGPQEWCRTSGRHTKASSTRFARSTGMSRRPYVSQITTH
ncbi:uncharacterized protein LOC123311532 [Coccinella septempunctata]|uniref:uncharacterized protein LOC123311532 n=1 Tax=Coccinella septempunctata TaxID=41139 RepID=UPI001D08C9FE|nr:uncharacterized protein LOC123311532 [Coccinella septempunctata]